MLVLVLVLVLVMVIALRLYAQNYVAVCSTCAQIHFIYVSLQASNLAMKQVIFLNDDYEGGDFLTQISKVCLT
jgi:hypothetical protein